MGMPRPRGADDVLGTVCNAPGKWNAMISYTQKSDRAKILAEKAKSSLEAKGKTVWFDIDMNDKSEAAMKE